MASWDWCKGNATFSAALACSLLEIKIFHVWELRPLHWGSFTRHTPAVCSLSALNSNVPTFYLDRMQAVYFSCLLGILTTPTFVIVMLFICGF